jgi:uncharacterized OsmC-like protein
MAQWPAGIVAEETESPHRKSKVVHSGHTIVHPVQDFSTDEMLFGLRRNQSLLEVNMDTETTTKTAATRKPPVPRNGVDTPKLFATIGAVADQPSLGKFQFRAQSRWMNGTHCRTTMAGFYGAGGEMQHVMPYVADADHPEILCGEDAAPAPVEWILHGLAACLTAGIANISAARGVNLESVECSLEGDIDLRGILGLSKEVRNGFQAIRVGFRIKGDAPDAKLREIVEQARARSAVFDILTTGVPVSIGMET